MNTRLRFKIVIDEMKESILQCLSELEKGYGGRKFYISDETGIPIDILTALLKQLKTEKKD